MYVVAGPNGAGKSTLARGARNEFGLEPIDADAIQRHSGMSSAAAWHEALRRCREAIEKRDSFLVETTLAGSDPSRPSTYLRLMREAKARGYRVDLTFIALANADAHVARVADRVAGGLHHIALHIADHALLLDNSSASMPFRLVLEAVSGTIISQGEDVPPHWVERIKWRFQLGITTEQPDP